MSQNSLINFAKFLKNQGKSPSTINSYSSDAKNFLTFIKEYNINTGDIEPDTLNQFHKYLTQELLEKENSARRAIIGVRQYYRFLDISNEIKATPFEESLIPNREENFNTVLNTTEINSLISSAQTNSSDLKSSRDTCIIYLLAFEGIKATELLNIEYRNLLKINPERYSLRIIGAKARTISLAKITSLNLNKYLSLYDKLDISNTQITSKKLIISFKNRNTNIPVYSMSRHGLKFMLYELGTKANIKHLNTERLRHHAVSYLKYLGMTREEIMQHLGLKQLGNIAKHFNVSKTNEITNEI